MDESTFLKNYNKRDFDTPLISVDSTLFTYHENQLKVLLVKRSNHPDLGLWGLPGGFIDLEKDQSIKDTALRKIKEKTKVIPPYVEQLQTVGNADRDKRGWSVTICYSALIAYQDCEAGIADVSDAAWITIDSLKDQTLAFDHQTIIEVALERLKQKALYSIVPAFALPEKFTLPELQHLHEVLIGKAIQKKSFRRRIEQAELLEDTGEKRHEGRRPAALYRMKQASGEYTFVRNLEG
ncbi:NUDIX domain-containing protein [Leucothrix sargassi]|nr:NUDIX domain-containing protein [Leucothrix sargassi]